jgi:predicted phosphodiesterase
MYFGVLGDIHGNVEAVERVLTRHPDIPFWLSVGDVGGDEGRYADPAAPILWIKGNNEDFDLVGRASAGVCEYPGLRYLPNGTAAEMGGLRVAGLGGTFAPTWYDTPARDLPHPPARPPGARGARTAAEIARDKRRHFVREEVEACKALPRIDVFLSHEAPRPFPVAARGGRAIDAGKTPVNEVLAAMQPRVHFFGHHHRFSDQVRQGVRSVCLDLITRSYLLVDATSMDMTKLEAPAA